MDFFKVRKPRGFHHEYMFVDSRKDRLKAVEKQAKRELGMIDETADDYKRIRGTFLNATKYTRRRRERQMSGGFVLNFGMIIILLLILFALWKLVLS